MKPPKISPCPFDRSATGPGIIEGATVFRTGMCAGRNRRFRVGCPCGARGSWARTVVRAIEAWNEMERNAP